LLLKVLVRPRSSRDRIEGLQGDALKISLTTPPLEGKANQACLRFLAGQLGLRPSQLSLSSGHRSHHKLIVIQDCPPQHILDRLHALLHGPSSGPTPPQPSPAPAPGNAKS
jgi:uncharacterized protein (TIGR00251 family)